MLFARRLFLDPGAPPTLHAQQPGKEYRPAIRPPWQRLLSLLFNRRNYRSHWALRGVSFQLQRGQCLGDWRQRCGQSTLLKLLAGHAAAFDGSLLRQGRVTAILELGAGFHPISPDETKPCTLVAV